MILNRHISLRKRHQEGMALIMVMIIILVLGMLAGKLAYNMKVETTLARNAIEQPDLEWMGRSGVEYAKFILSQEALDNSRPYDALNECWAGGTGGTMVDNINASAFADPAMIPQCIPMENIPLGRGTFSLKITDLDRKFNINVADQFILQNALSKIGVDAAMIPIIVDSILDWRDPDTAKRPSGTDGEDYVDNPNPGYPPYFVKNGPIDDITELLLIRGVTPAMFWGSSGGSGYTSMMPQVSNPISRSHFEEPVYTVGLVDLFTPLSGRLVNLNTASAVALQVLPQIDENIAQAIIQARAGPDGVEGNDDDTPFRSPAELGIRVPGFNPAFAQQLGNLFSVRSLVFEAKVSVNIGGNQREYIAIIRRNNPRDIQVLTTYWH